MEELADIVEEEKSSAGFVSAERNPVILAKHYS